MEEPVIDSGFVMFIKDIIRYLLDNYNLFVVIALCIFMTIIVCILNLMKKPIKLLTGKIKNEKLRKLANKSIIILSFGLSALGWAIIHWVLPDYFDYDLVLILLNGAFPVVVYALGDGIITKDQAKQIVDKVEEIVEDGKVEKEEIKQFIKAEDKLDKLLKGDK